MYSFIISWCLVFLIAACENPITHFTEPPPKEEEKEIIVPMPNDTVGCKYG